MENIKKWVDPHKGKRITAYIDDECYQELKDLCKETGASMSVAVRAAVACLLSSGSAESILVSSKKLHGYNIIFTNQTKGDN